MVRGLGRPTILTRKGYYRFADYRPDGRLASAGHFYSGAWRVGGLRFLQQFVLSIRTVTLLRQRFFRGIRTAIHRGGCSIHLILLIALRSQISRSVLPPTASSVAR